MRRPGEIPLDRGTRRRLPLGHRRLNLAATGSLAELHEILRAAGYYYVSQTGKREDVTRVVTYRHDDGRHAKIVMVGKGRPRIWTGRKVGLVSIGPTADVYTIVEVPRR